MSLEMRTGRRSQDAAAVTGTVPAAFLAPLRARLPGHTLRAIELPGVGL